MSLRKFINSLVVKLPESREAFIVRANQGCIDALSEGRTEPLEGAPEGAFCYQGGVPCADGYCPVLKMRITR